MSEVHESQLTVCCEGFRAQGSWCTQDPAEIIMADVKDIRVDTFERL